MIIQNPLPIFYRKTIGSGLFNGTSDYLKILDSEDFNLDTEYTIDFWIYPTSFSGYKGIIGTGTVQGDGGRYEGWTIYTLENGIIRVSNDGAYNDIVTSGDKSLTLNQWNHVALINKSPDYVDLNIYINGFGGNTPDTQKGLIYRTEGIVIGRYRISETGNYFSGNLDELRISKGIARWTEDFTPPTVPYVIDGYTKLLLQFNGINGSQIFIDETGKTITPYSTVQIDTSNYKF